MIRKGWKWLFLGVGVTIVMLYMLEMTTNGIERVYGPMQLEQTPYVQSISNEQSVEEMSTEVVPKHYDSELERQIAQLELDIMELKKMALEKEKQEIQSKLIVNQAGSEPSVNRLADSASGVLQQASGSSIQFIAGIFQDMIN